MGGWTRSSRGTRVPQTEPCPRCHIPCRPSFQDRDDAKPPAQPKRPKPAPLLGSQGAPSMPSPGSTLSLTGRTPPRAQGALSPARDTPADPIKGAWSPHTGAGGVITAAALPHTPQQLKIARRKEINSRRSPARSHQPNQHRLCSLPLAFHRGFYPRLLGFDFLPPITPGWKGTGIDFTPNVTLLSPPHRGCAAGRRGECHPTEPPQFVPQPQLHSQELPDPLFHARKQLLQLGPIPVPRPGGFVHPPPLQPGRR